MLPRPAPSLSRSRYRDGARPRAADRDRDGCERLPAPPHHRVVVIGVLLFDSSYEPKRINAFSEAKGEAGMLADFSRFLEERRPCLVTFNGRSFDMPVIATRCLRYGISLRHYYSARDVRYRFTADGHLDVMDYLADFGAAKPARLDIIAKLCGMPGKVGIEGKDVGPMVHAGRLAEVKNYCLCDVAQTAAVFPACAAAARRARSRTLCRRHALVDHHGSLGRATGAGRCRHERAPVVARRRTARSDCLTPVTPPIPPGAAWAARKSSRCGSLRGPG